MTLGVRYGKFKLEGSAFNGREPDENRYSFDRPKLDSYSGRLSFNPNANLALQVSEAFVNSPELLHPEENILRTTSSVVYTGRINSNSFGNLTALWGLNSGTLDENALLLEGVIVLRKLAIYSRYEWVQKSTEELDLNADDYGAESLFAINTLTLGAGYDILSLKSMNVAVGGQVSGYSADGRLDRLYGRHPLSFECYIRIYPPRMFAMRK